MEEGISIDCNDEQLLNVYSIREVIAIGIEIDLYFQTSSCGNGNLFHS